VVMMPVTARPGMPVMCVKVRMAEMAMRVIMRLGRGMRVGGVCHGSPEGRPKYTCVTPATSAPSRGRDPRRARGP
jgi:hypothetical protein